MSVELEVQYTTAMPDPPREAEIRVWAEAALADLAGSEALVRIVDEAEGAELNRRYRQQPHATNVLSFPLEAPCEVGSAHLGDVVICAPVVAREARDQDKTAAAHWAHLVIHGLLHLRGYAHDSDADAAVMETLETRLMARLGYPDPYERAG